MKKAIRFIVLIFIMCIVLIAISPLFMFMTEDDLIRKKWNNPYINQNFSEWKTETIDRIGTIKIPNNWTLHKQNNEYYIEDHNGVQIAICTVMGDQFSEHNSIDSFLHSITGDSTSIVSYQYDNGFPNVYGSYFFSINMLYESNQHKFHCILLKNNTIHIEYSSVQFIMVFKDSVMDYNEIYEIAEAIIYSYTME